MKFQYFLISVVTLIAYNSTKLRVCSIQNVLLVTMMAPAHSLDHQDHRKSSPQHREQIHGSRPSRMNRLLQKKTFDKCAPQRGPRPPPVTPQAFYGLGASTWSWQRPVDALGRPWVPPQHLRDQQEDLRGSGAEPDLHSWGWYWIPLPLVSPC